VRGGGGVRHDDSAAARHRGALTGVSNEEVGSDKAPPAQSLDGEFRAAGMPACDAMTDDGDSEDSGVFVFRGIDGDETERAVAPRAQRSSSEDGGGLVPVPPSDVLVHGRGGIEEVIEVLLDVADVCRRQKICLRAPESRETLHANLTARTSSKRC